MPWKPIPLDTPLGELSGKHVAASGIGVAGKPTLVLLSVGRRSRGRVWLSCMDVGVRTEPAAIPHTASVPTSSTLGEALQGFGSVRATNAGEVPEIKWPGNSRPPRSGWHLAGIHTPAAAMVVAGLLTQQHVLVLYGALLTLAFLLMWHFSHRFHMFSVASTPPYVREGSRQLMASAVLARLGDAHPPGPSPAQRVDHVKAAYGELAGDIVYRIESSALFDPAVDQTQRFQLALLAWDPASPDADRLATQVEESFAAARETAEALGLAHLPQTARATARRAARSAALARAATTEDERIAAARHVANLLGSLALYWMPTVDPATASLIGERKMIEPAP